MTLFNELRNWVFAAVAQQGVRRLSAQTFEHLHRLDLAFHLNRQTGGLSRALDRGSRGITFLLNAMVFNVVPLVLEIALVCGVLVRRWSAQRNALLRCIVALTRAPVVQLRVVVCGADRGHARHVHDVHVRRHAVAHQVPRRDEQARERRVEQNGRLAHQL